MEYMGEEMKLIGFSLTFCIQDMIVRDMSADDVVAIYCGTKASDRKLFETLCSGYTRSYWVRFPSAAMRLALQLWDDGKIIQPSLGKNPLMPVDPSQTRWALLLEEPSCEI